MNPFHEGFLALKMNLCKIRVGTFKLEDQLGPGHAAELWAAVIHAVQLVAQSWHNFGPRH